MKILMAQLRMSRMDLLVVRSWLSEVTRLVIARA